MTLGNDVFALFLVSSTVHPSCGLLSLSFMASHGFRVMYLLSTVPHKRDLLAQIHHIAKKMNGHFE